jgi:glutathione S-transferase
MIPPTAGEGSMFGEVSAFRDPVFATYAIAAAIMILKAVAMSWLTVVQMTRVKGGFRSPEDVRKTRLNPDPNPEQMRPNESVERMRRIHLNDLENIPFFLAAGLIWTMSRPSLLEAQIVLYAYVITRLAHFAAYLSARSHDIRAMLWTPGSLLIVYMAVRTLMAAAGV